MVREGFFLMKMLTNWMTALLLEKLATQETSHSKALALFITKFSLDHKQLLCSNIPLLSLLINIHIHNRKVTRLLWCRDYYCMSHNRIIKYRNIRDLGHILVFGCVNFFTVFKCCYLAVRQTRCWGTELS